MKNNTKLERAKIFLPFDALKGFQEALREKEKILVDKKILSIGEKEKTINKKHIFHIFSNCDTDTFLFMI